MVKIEDEDRLVELIKLYHLGQLANPSTTHCMFIKPDDVMLLERSGAKVNTRYLDDGGNMLEVNVYFRNRIFRCLCKTPFPVVP